MESRGRGSNEGRGGDGGLFIDSFRAGFAMTDE